MSTLTVGAGQQFSTIAAAVNAAQGGDTVDVQAGVYTNDFTTIRKSLTLEAVGGTVTMLATVQTPDGKAILTEGGPGITVSIDGFVFAGAVVRDQNGAGIRYEGGTLHIAHSGFFANQNGILGAPDGTGIITIDHSEFGANGVGGSGYTHNIYIGDIASFALTNCYVHDANVGHEVKSRAENNVISGNVIADNAGSASYEIDLPNGGNAMISGNTIQQGANSQNPNIIAYGEEGMHYGASLTVSGNVIVNDLGHGPALWNASGIVAAFADNAVYGFGGAGPLSSLVNGPANAAGTTVLAARPVVPNTVPVVPNTVPVVPNTVPVVPDTVPGGAGAQQPLAAVNGPADAGTTVFRFFDRTSGTQFLTASPSERAAILATRPDLAGENAGFGAVTPQDNSASSVYRFFDMGSGTHFFTSSSAERDQIAATRPDLHDEGVGFYEYAAAQPGTAAIYRFFDTHAGTHFFTSSDSERASILSSRPDLAPEGIAFYAPPAAS